MGGICFIAAAALLTLALASVYVGYGALPQAGSVLYGIKAVMIVVMQAIWNLSRTVIKSKLLMLIGALAVFSSALGVNVLLVLLGAGVAAMVLKKTASALKTMSPATVVLPISGNMSNTLVRLGTGVSFGLLPVFTFFLKVGAVLFGSGYVLLAFLRSDLVLRLQRLTDKQLLDANAVGQVTPGPVFTTATFIGYLLVPGAVVATGGIFLPPFIFIAIIGPLVRRVRKSAILDAFLDGVNVGALALMLVVTRHLGRAALVDLTTIALAV
jgi:chromate transporter